MHLLLTQFCDPMVLKGKFLCFFIGKECFVFLKFLWEFDFLLFVSFCILVSHFNCSVCAIDLYPALLIWSSYSGPWRAFDSVYEEVIFLLLFEPFLGLFVDPKANCFHFDNWPYNSSVFPVNCWDKSPEPWVSQYEGIFPKISDIEVLLFFFVPLFYQEINCVGDGSILVRGSIYIVDWLSYGELLCFQAKFYDHF